jgi:hypothetical protein
MDAIVDCKVLLLFNRRKSEVFFTKRKAVAAIAATAFSN